VSGAVARTLQALEAAVESENNLRVLFAELDLFRLDVIARELKASRRFLFGLPKTGVPK
jgi:hypothetical protein